MLACDNAAGVMMPPHFITKGKWQQYLEPCGTENVPFGSFISVSDSGWTKQVYITFHHSSFKLPTDTKCVWHLNASMLNDSLPPYRAYPSYGLRMSS